jgi:hypothetical protein
MPIRLDGGHGDQPAIPVESSVLESASRRSAFLRSLKRLIRFSGRYHAGRDAQIIVRA